MLIRNTLLSFILLSLSLEATASDSLKQVMHSSGVQGGFAVILSDGLVGKEAFESLQTLRDDFVIHNLVSSTERVTALSVGGRPES